MVLRIIHSSLCYYQITMYVSIICFVGKYIFNIECCQLFYPLLPHLFCSSDYIKLPRLRSHVESVLK